MTINKDEVQKAVKSLLTIYEKIAHLKDQYDEALESYALSVGVKKAHMAKLVKASYECKENDILEDLTEQIDLFEITQ